MASPGDAVPGPSKVASLRIGKQPPKKQLSADEIFDILADGNISDLDGISDEDGDDVIEAARCLRQPIIGCTVLPPDDEIEEDIDGDVSDFALDVDGMDREVHEEALDEFANYPVTGKKEIRWRHVNRLEPPAGAWNARAPTVEDVIEQLNPIEYFERYMPYSIYELMVEMTNIYALTKDNNFIPTSVRELKIFVGLHILMGTLGFPRIALYWDTALHLDVFVKNMSRNRFYKLRNNVHVTNINIVPEGNDRLHKVCPMFDAVRKRCNELEMERELAIDEQMVPFKGQLSIKQYMKGKPSPWGY